MFFCTVYCNIITQHKPTKCTFSKLTFQFLILLSPTCFEGRGRTHSSTYRTAYTDACKTYHTIPAYTTVFLKKNSLGRNM